MPVQLQNNSTLAVTLKAPSSGDFSLVLPSSLGTSGQSIVTDGSGTLSFATAVASFTGLTFSTSSSPQATGNIVASGGTTDQGLAISPKGTGGVLMNIPDGAATGGNARGTRTIDFQCLRSLASNVATGTASAILGGSNNSCGDSYSIVMGTGSSTSDPYSIVLGNTLSAEGIAINSSSANDIWSGFPIVANSNAQNAIDVMFAGQTYVSGPGRYSLVYPKPSNTGTSSGIVTEVCFGLYYTGSTAIVLSQNGDTSATSSGWITTVDGTNSGTVVGEGAVVAISSTGDCKVWYWYGGNQLGSSFGSAAVLSEDAGASGWSLSLAQSGATATGGSIDTIRWYGWNIGQAMNVT